MIEMLEYTGDITQSLLDLQQSIGFISTTSLERIA